MNGGLNAAEWEGNWQASTGYWVGCIKYMFVDSPGGANPHPAESFTDAQKDIVREALKEWVDLPDSKICFDEVTEGPDITFRWEDKDLFESFPNINPGPGLNDGSGMDIAGFAQPQDFEGLQNEPPSATYPVNEIYFNTNPGVDNVGDTSPSDNDWHFGDEPIPAGKWDFLTVAKHEIGHLLGFKHNRGERESMGDWTATPGSGPDRGVRQHLDKSDEKVAKEWYPHSVYKCYDIDGHDPDVSVDLKTQFGLQENVAVGKATLLCPPARKNGEGDLEKPHLKCYNIVGDDPDAKVNLTTQFGVEEDVEVGQAKLLCVPAIKQVLPLPTPTPTPTTPPAAPYYKCYEISGPAPNPTIKVKLTTQFSDETDVEVKEPKFLCAPALKKAAGADESEFEGDLTFDHLKCYNIAGHDPNVSVNLKTQFGDEQTVAVGPAKLLCDQAHKAGGGGIAEAIAEGPASTAETSGSSSARDYTAPIAAAAVAGVLALAAGGWYVRRRLS